MEHCISDWNFFLYMKYLWFHWIVFFATCIPVMNSWGQASSTDLNIIGLNSLFQRYYNKKYFLTPSLGDGWIFDVFLWIISITHLRICTHKKKKKKGKHPPQNWSDTMTSQFFCCVGFICFTRLGLDKWF